MHNGFSLKYILKGIDTSINIDASPFVICLKYILKGIDTKPKRHTIKSVEQRFEIYP